MADPRRHRHRPADGRSRRDDREHRVGGRDRAASFLAIGTGSAGLFALFLSLTFYLQDTKGFTPLETGLAFLPGLGMLLLTRLGVDTGYATHVLPSLVLIGVGFGLAVAPSFAISTAVPARDSGVASGVVNTSQQVGGSIGTALLSTRQCPPRPSS